MMPMSRGGKVMQKNASTKADHSLVHDSSYKAVVLPHRGAATDFMSTSCSNSSPASAVGWQCVSKPTLVSSTKT